MAGKEFDLQPAKQCTETETGHFGELYKEVFQGQSGLLARQVSYTPDEWGGVQRYSMDQSRGDLPQDPGPYNKNVLEMAFGNDIYSLGQDTKTLSINYKPVETGSPQYTAAVAKMEKAEGSINFNAPACTGDISGLWQSLDQKK